MLRQIVGGTAVFAIFAVLSTFSANGQEGAPRQFPRVEFFVGYSYAYLGLGSQSSTFLPGHFAFRLFQTDSIPTRLDGKWESDFRLGTGMIVKF